ncbi:MAG TPA: hypothetical protein H9912_08620, partial [Candidatus Eisenbergiella stercorigallinarum]|nr:hypothetical protein [Candidatus Eisenbergiella stercorigallinarum]
MGVTAGGKKAASGGENGRVRQQAGEEESTQDNTQVYGGVIMGDYKPPFTITNEILSYVSSVSEKMG